MKINLFELEIIKIEDYMDDYDFVDSIKENY